MLLRACAAGIVVTVCLVSVAGACSDAIAEPPPAFEVSADVRIPTTSVDSQLGNVVVAAREHGAQAALRTARTNGLDTVSGRIRVVVEATPADARDALAARGGIVQATAGELTEALVPVGSIAAVSAARGVEQVRAPYAAFTLGIDSEGIASVDGRCLAHGRCEGSRLRRSRSSTSASHGLAGRQSSRRAAGRVDDRRLLRRRRWALRQEHGTAVAEIVHEMAPDAQLYADLRRLRGRPCERRPPTRRRTESRSSTTRSAGTTPARGDGTGAAGTPDAIVAAARADGHPLGERGRERRRRSTGAARTPTQTPTTSTTSPAPTKETRFVLFAGEEVCGFLKWDAWPTTRQDYDLYLVDEADGVAVEPSPSTTSRTGRCRRPKSLCYTNSDRRVARLHVL